MINVCFITDENYVLPTLVAIKSIIVNSENALSINVVTTNLSQKYEQLFYQLETENAKINVLQIQNPCENIPTNNKNVTNAAYIKLILPNILKDIDKMLYLDGDTLILKDLKELYDTDIEDKYAGVVSDLCVCMDSKYVKDYGLENYFNSGVILMNLAKMRQESMVDKLLDYAKNRESRRFADQDVFNFVFKENVKWLPIKYNFFNLYYDEKFITSFLNISAEEYYKITNSIVITHYAGIKMNKMVDNTKDEYLNLWYEYYNMLLDSFYQKDGAIFICLLYQKFINSNITIIKKKLDNSQQEINILNNKNNNLQQEINKLNNKKENIFQKIFSVRNENGHKIITILFVKIKFRIIA